MLDCQRYCRYVRYEKRYAKMSNKCFYDYEDQIFGFEMAKPKKMEYTQEDIMFIDRPQSLNGQSPKSAEYRSLKMPGFCFLVRML